MTIGQILRRAGATGRGLFVWLLLIGCSPVAGAAVDPWQREIDALIAADAAHPPQHGVLFVGSSSIRLWSTLAADFPGIPVVNRGFGGSRIEDATRNVARLVSPYHPNVVVLYAGDNDIAEGRSSRQVLADFEAFVASVRQESPRTPILYLSIKPSVARFALWPRMREANEMIGAWARGRRDIVMIDVTKTMLDAVGQPRPELLQPDGLHMRPAGYAIWIEALQPVLARYGFVSATRRVSR
ncbi:MAG: SGNH/GDSL hydrolase family protein [Rudaea sp.]